MEERREDDVKTALVAIAKDEGPYIREWVVYHKKVCGFDEIFVYENDSSDSTRSELESMAAEGLCGWKPWPRGRHDPPQQTAYGDALAHSQNREWLCFMDIDEFLVLDSHMGIGELVSGFADDAGSISFNWVVFYSTEKNRSPDPVTKRVKFCYGDPHVKTIARVKAVRGCGIHTFDLAEGFRHMHCCGREYFLDQSDLPLDAKICTVKESQICDWGAGQINHYLMKSEEELRAKDERGDATAKGHVRKNTVKFYRQLAAKKEHSENRRIEKYIESRMGLDDFYKEMSR